MNTADKIKHEYILSLDLIANNIDVYSWENKYQYANWLAQSYYFVRHSTRLLGLASGLTPLGNDTLHLRMAKHISEEFAHDKLALKDIENLGYKLTQFEELAYTKLFYRNQYYGISTMGPYYLMGYILFLEGLAITKGPEIFKKVNQLYSKKSSVFVSVHAEEDLDHIEKAFDQIKNLDAENANIVIESLKVSGEIYKNIMCTLASLNQNQQPTITNNLESII